MNICKVGICYSPETYIQNQYTVCLLLLFMNICLLLFTYLCVTYEGGIGYQNNKKLTRNKSYTNICCYLFVNSYK